jgi:aminoglycoside phosphotransferase (APT) family kinase protein
MSAWLLAYVPQASLIGHNDIAPYNVCFDGDDVAGVFDWDLAGPTTPVMELAFIAGNCVPLWRDLGMRPPRSASRASARRTAASIRCRSWICCLAGSR